MESNTAFIIRCHLSFSYKLRSKVCQRLGWRTAGYDSGDGYRSRLPTGRYLCFFKMASRGTACSTFSLIYSNWCRVMPVTARCAISTWYTGTKKPNPVSWKQSKPSWRHNQMESLQLRNPALSWICPCWSGPADTGKKPFDSGVWYRPYIAVKL